MLPHYMVLCIDRCADYNSSFSTSVEIQHIKTNPLIPKTDSTIRGAFRGGGGGGGIWQAIC